MCPPIQELQRPEPRHRGEDPAHRRRPGGSSHPTRLSVGARSSPLARAQVEEVHDALRRYGFDVEFACTWLETLGDRDRTTSLRSLAKTDFFTKELDEALLQGRVRVAIHSAKDLPDPLAEGLCLAALTRGVDSRDALVLRDGEQLQGDMLVATSSERRESAVRALGVASRFTDLRGTIGERLALLERRAVDGVVIAEAALIRLGLTKLPRIMLPGPTVEGQGQLAIVCRQDDAEMRAMFRCLDARRRILYLGTDPIRYACEGILVHYPLIRTEPLAGASKRLDAVWDAATHVVFTSPSAVEHAGELSLVDKQVLAVGEGTATALRARSASPLVAPYATQEGMIALLQTLDLRDAFVLWPRSSGARALLEQHLRATNVRYFAVDTYTTHAQAPGPLPDLAAIDELVFTSPSTVRAYVELFGALPQGKVLTPIGPVTAECLQRYRMVT